MTKKHFELIARAMYATMPVDTAQDRDSVRYENDSVRYAQWQATLFELSRVLPATNGNFQRDKFERFARTGRY